MSRSDMAGSFAHRTSRPRTGQTPCAGPGWRARARPQAPCRACKKLGGDRGEIDVVHLVYSMIKGACNFPPWSRPLMISMMSSGWACTALRASTRALSLGEVGSAGSTPMKRRAAGWPPASIVQLLVRDGDGADFHVAADHDRARPLVDHHSRNRAGS